MPQFQEFYAEDGASVQAYKVEEPHEVRTLNGTQVVAPGQYVVGRDRPEYVDVVDADGFEEGYSTQEPDTDGEDEVQSANASADTDDTGSEYDPSAHTVAEVQAYLATHPGERDAVLAKERQGDNRASLLK